MVQRRASRFTTIPFIRKSRWNWFCPKVVWVMSGSKYDDTFNLIEGNNFINTMYSPLYWIPAEYERRKNTIRFSLGR